MSATPWDLDELQRLSAAATPGPWGASASFSIVPPVGEYGCVVTTTGADFSIVPPVGEWCVVTTTGADRALIVALRNAAGAGMLERMAKLEAVAKACDMREYEAHQGSCAICNEPDCEDCPGNDIRVALDALDALRTKETR